MNDTSIRAELRRAAMEREPWYRLNDVAFDVAKAFLNHGEASFRYGEHNRASWFFLLVAEAL